MPLVTVQRSPSNNSTQSKETAPSAASTDDFEMGRNSRSLSECYFAGKGTALVLPAASEAQKSSRRTGAAGSKIQEHLQSMFYLLRSEETLKMAVKLESVHPGRTRYLVVVSRMGARAEESCLLGIDCNEKTTVGLVLKVLADTTITLDGDGGFSVSVCGRHHIFKPVSVQAMWSALQTLHKASSKAREHNYFQGGLTHSWVDYYEKKIESDRSCLNEWHAMDNLESRRPPSPDSVRTKPTEREETEKIIRSTLKEIMMSVDLDEVTSKYIRSHLEEDLDMDLGEYKSFIDQEMLTILGQMDSPTEIFEHVYLGSEWNASNYDELRRNGVGHILNVTREIDNFFPGTFDYLNIRVYDDENTDLLKYWDKTFKYISKAQKKGSKVLVHCKMGVSRSASVVIAYAMKAYNWNFEDALRHVKDKRNCIKPNTSFLSQLETYEGILDANKNKEKLQRSKSETNLKSPGLSAKDEPHIENEPSSNTNHLTDTSLQVTMSGEDLRNLGSRPKSWSPDNTLLHSNNLNNNPKLLMETTPISRSLENLNNSPTCDDLKGKCTPNKSANSATNVLLPCDNGESYSVSPNQIMHIPNRDLGESLLASVQDRVNELEAKKSEQCSKNLLVQFERTEAAAAAASTATTNEVDSSCAPSINNESKSNTYVNNNLNNNGTTNDCDLKFSASDENAMRAAAAQQIGSTVPEVRLRVKCVPARAAAIVTSNSISNKDSSDLFSNNVDRVFDREERRQQRMTVIPMATDTTSEEGSMGRNYPSRQSSWSSCDSAVVLGYQGEGREAPSRHSSWGSGDTRTLPSRNSSWGSYDIRSATSNDKPLQATGNDLSDSATNGGVLPYEKEDIPWNPGTVRRTKRQLEESTSRIQEDKAAKISCDSQEAALNGVKSDYKNIPACKGVNSEEKDLCKYRLSMSAPETSNIAMIAEKKSGAKNLSRSTSSIGSNIVNSAQCSSVKQHKNYLESLQKDLSRRDEVPELDTTTTGIVRNRKKEFEAKTNLGEQRIQQLNVNSETAEEKKNRVNSLPSSPISLHEKKSTSPTSFDPGENFKELRGKFEKGNTHENKANRINSSSCVKVMDKSPVRNKQTMPTIISNFGKNGTEGEFKRPPMAPVVRNTTPNVVLATVIATANKKQQQQQYGKSHPLARLEIKTRHNNPVYNTM